MTTFDDDEPERRGPEWIKEQMQADGFRLEGTHPGDPEAITVDAQLNLPPDGRDPWLICQMCIRTMNKKKRREIRPGQLCCPACFSQPQLDLHPPQIELWLATPIEFRRAWVALRFGIDPATVTDTPATAVEHKFFTDVDDAPLAVETVPINGVYLNLAMPNLFWHLVEERGWGVAPEVASP